MATFGNFSKDMASIASMCANNANKSDMAAFVMVQQDLAQAETIKNRIEGNNAKTGAGPGIAAKPGGKSGSAASKSAGSAYDRMAGMLKNLK